MKKELVIILLLTALSGVLHFWRLGFPPTVVFDEAHFTSYATHYASRTGFYDIHPPLGKMLYAGVVRAMGVKEPHDFIRFWRTADGEFKTESDGGKPYGSFPYLALRTLSAIVGIALVPMLYIFARLLGFSALGAGITGLFLALDNGLLLQTRLVLLDGFTLFFGLLGLIFFIAKDALVLDHKKKTIAAVMAALALGLAGSVKLTGFGFVLGVLITALVVEYKNRHIPVIHNTFSLAPLGLKKFAALAMVPFFALFAVHRMVVPLDQELAFWHILLNNNGAAGASAFLTSIRALPFGGLAANGLGYIGDIFFSIGGNLTSGAHPSRSFFFTWPLNYKAVIYWYTPSQDAFIYFLGNIILWPLSGMVTALVAARALFKRMLPDASTIFLLALFFANCLPFAFFIITGRPTYMYHYLAALLFAVMLLAKELAALVNSSSRKITTITLGVVLTLVIVGFLITAPLTYGFPTPSWLSMFTHAAF